MKLANADTPLSGGAASESAQTVDRSSTQPRAVPINTGQSTPATSKINPPIAVTPLPPAGAADAPPLSVSTIRSSPWP